MKYRQKCVSKSGYEYERKKNEHKYISESGYGYESSASEMPKQIRYRYEQNTGRNMWANPGMSMNGKNRQKSLTKSNVDMNKFNRNA